MRTVTVYENAGSDAVTTLVVEWEDQRATAFDPHPKDNRRKRPPRSRAIFKKALDSALAHTEQKIRPIADGPEVVAVKRDAVRAEFLKTYTADSPKAKTMAFGRCEKDAITAGLMTAHEIGSPESAATFFCPTAST